MSNEFIHAMKNRVGNQTPGCQIFGKEFVSTNFMILQREVHTTKLVI